MVLADLAHYDGSAGFLVDTNVWIDCIASDHDFGRWSLDHLQSCSEKAPLHVNVIIYTELLVPGTEVAALDELLDVFETRRSPLPWACAALAARAFAHYRRRGGSRSAPLPDFYLGAHAAVSNFTVLTRDRAVYRTYFPALRIVE